MGIIEPTSQVAAVEAFKEADADTFILLEPSGQNGENERWPNPTPLAMRAKLRIW